MRVRPSPTVSASPGTRLRCTICQRFTRTVTASGRCEPCAGVLPLDFFPHRSEDSAGLARECAELGEHDWDVAAAQPCTCGQPHAVRICARCLQPEVPDCGGVA